MGARVSSGKDSKQDYATPLQFIKAVQIVIGEVFAIDLAASESNKKADAFFSEEENSLLQNWSEHGLGWLNPAFGMCKEFSEKCHRESLRGWRGAMLTPASVDSIWWNNHVHHLARVRFPRPRIQFVGADDPYPKPLAVSFYGISSFSDNHSPAFYEPWKWPAVLGTPDLFE